MCTRGIARVTNLTRIEIDPGPRDSGLFRDARFGLRWERGGAQLSTDTRNGYEEQVAAFVNSVAAHDNAWAPMVARLRHHIARLEETWHLLESNPA